MTWGATAAAAATVIGSSMMADASKGAANKSAQAQIDAANIAANAAKFKPYNISSGFGTATTNEGSASYQLDPTLAAYRNQMYQGANAVFPTTFNLQDAAKQYYQGQQDILAPERERSYANMQTGLFNSGRGGLAVGATGARPYSGAAGLAATNPELAAYYNSIAQQDLQLQQNAETYAGQQLDNALKRSQGMFSYGTGLENLGLDTLYQSANIGNKMQASSAAAGNLLAQGMTNASKTQYDAAMANNRIMGNAFNTVGNAAGSYDWSKVFGSTGANGTRTYAPTGAFVNDTTDWSAQNQADLAWLNS
jgi:hypothetical protein